MVVPQNVMVREIGMADAISDYSHRGHLQSRTMDGQSGIGGNYLKSVTGMAGALSGYSHRDHLQSHTMDGQSRIGGSYLKIVTGD